MVPSTPRTSVRNAPSPADELLEECPLLDDDEFVVELLLDERVEDDEFVVELLLDEESVEFVLDVLND